MDHPVVLDLRMRGIKGEDLAEAFGQKAGFSGTLDGELAVKGTPAAPEIHSTLNVGKFTTQAGTAGQDLKLVAETSDHRLSLNLAQVPASKAPLALRAILPLQFAKDHGHLRFAENGLPIEGSLQLQQAPLDGWLSLLDATGSYPLRGATGSGELKVVGTVGKPALEGSLSVSAREVSLFGPEKLRTINLPLVMDGKSPAMVLTNGTASYGGKPVSLSGTVTLAGDNAGIALKIAGNDLPVAFGSAFATTGSADLQLTSSENGPLLGGTLTLKPATVDLARGLTPCFTPPGLAMAGNPLAPVFTEEPLANLQLAIQIKSSAEATPAASPLVSVDISVKGSAQSPKVTGKLTAVNQSLRLPSGTFLLPEAHLLLEGTGARLDPAPAYGFTSIGPCVLTPSLDGTGTFCSITGPAGTTAADMILALASPSPKRGEIAANGAAILQGASWLRQKTLFPSPATAWSTAFHESPVAGALGFYGTPWAWNWSQVSPISQPTKISR
jgi:autotransporter translocation and assembly factor TamB